METHRPLTRMMGDRDDCGGEGWGYYRHSATPDDKAILAGFTHFGCTRPKLLRYTILWPQLCTCDVDH